MLKALLVIGIARKRDAVGEWEGRKRAAH